MLKNNHSLHLLLVLQPSSSLDRPSDDPPFISIHSHSFPNPYSDVSKVFFDALQPSYWRSSYPSGAI
jgi:hypothetical protein